MAMVSPHDEHSP